MNRTSSGISLPWGSREPGKEEALRGLGFSGVGDPVCDPPFWGPHAWPELRTAPQIPILQDRESPELVTTPRPLGQGQG